MDTSRFPFFEHMDTTAFFFDEDFDVIKRYFNYLILLFGKNTIKAYVNESENINVQLNKEIEKFNPDLENIFNTRGNRCITINKKTNPTLGEYIRSNYIHSNFDVNNYDQSLSAEQLSEFRKIFGNPCAYSNVISPHDFIIDYTIDDREGNYVALFNFICPNFTKDLFDKYEAILDEIIEIIINLNIDIGITFFVIQPSTNYDEDYYRLKQAYQQIYIVEDTLAEKANEDEVIEGAQEE